MLNHHVPSRTMTFWRPLSHFQTEPNIKLLVLYPKKPIILETWPFSEPLGLGRDVQVRGTTPKRSHTFHMAAAHGVRRQNGWLVCDALRMGYLANIQQKHQKLSSKWFGHKNLEIRGSSRLMFPVHKRAQEGRSSPECLSESFQCQKPSVKFSCPKHKPLFPNISFEACEETWRTCSATGSGQGGACKTRKVKGDPLGFFQCLP